MKYQRLEICRSRFPSSVDAGAAALTVSVSPLAYGLATLLAALVAVGLCVGARVHTGPWTDRTAKTLGIILLGEQVSWQIQMIIHHNWTVTTSLPLDLCDFTCFVAAAACFLRSSVCTELTWFWGLGGTLQAIITPDIETPFPHLAFDNYVIEHLGIVVAAVYLVIGLRIFPRRRAVARVFGLTVAFALLCAIVDLATGADYLFLRSRPSTVSLLNLLGPWPWYLASCAGVALVFFVVLDLPFAWSSQRRRDRRQRKPRRTAMTGPLT